MSGGPARIHIACRLLTLLPRLANFGTFVALASYSRQKAKSNKRDPDAAKRRGKLLDYHVKYVTMLQTLVSMALTLYMWYVYAHGVGPAFSLIAKI